jgi:hypothetical protein
MRRHRHTTTVRNLVLAGVTSAAFITPAAASARLTPDVRGHAAAAQVSVDLRSPDVRDAGTPVQTDLRSPDAALPVRTPTAQPIAVPSSVGSHADSTDFDFGSAVIGAGTVLLVALASVGTMWALGRRRSPASRRGVAPLGS